MCRRIQRLYTAGVIALGLVGWSGVVSRHATGQELPPAEVEPMVKKHFAGLPDYQPGDIISRSNVEPLFAQLADRGWNVADRKAVLAAVPADDNFLVTSFRTKSGRKFMRDVAKYPEAYDRLDRLARLPYGKLAIRRLIRGPDGYRMIEYMTTTRGGIELGKQLSNAPQGKNFNRPTGRLYTAELLLKRLKKSCGNRLRGCSRTSSAFRS